MIGKNEQLYQLVTWGLSRSNLRDPLQPRHWLGLSKDDRDILTAWVCERASLITGMWTDVQCGIIPVLDSVDDSAMGRKVVAGKWPWRIDCILQMDNIWRLIEVKPFAGHEALGQVLAYKFYVEQTLDQLEGCTMTIVTDNCCEPARDVYKHFGVELIEVGPVLGVR